MPRIQNQSRHLIIDGYNVIHACPQLKALLLSGNQDSARELLIQAAQSIHDAEDTRVTVVFDGKGPTTTIDRPCKELSFSCIFAPSHASADVILERIILNSKFPKLVTVATNDIMILESARANGAFTITPTELFDWIDRARGGVRRHIKPSTKKWNTLDFPEAPA